MNRKPMRDKLPRQPKQPRLEWPGGVVPEWAKVPQNAKRRTKGPGGKPGAAGSKRERLQKVMAQSGHGSRRNIEILIAQGHLTINGQLAKLGDSVGPGDKVKLDGHVIHLRYGEPLPRVLMYHKPTGEIVSRDDPENRPTVFDKLPKVTAGRWVSVGRLDFNTEGLLLFTTNGELANRMTHPRFEVEREYAVRVMGELNAEQTDKLLKTGIDIDGEPCKFDTIEDRGGEGSNHWYHVTLREGKNREVRRMMEGVGLMVSRLTRVRFGAVELPTFLKRGMMREMEEEQIQELMSFAGMNEPPPNEDGEVVVEDEHDNIGNRYDPKAHAAPAEDDGVDDDYGNRVPVVHQQRAERPEPDGNKGTYVPGPDKPEVGNRPHRGGSGGGERRPQGGGRKFGFKKGPRGEGVDGNVAPREGNFAPREGNGSGGQPHGGRGRGGGQGQPHGERHGQGKGPGQGRGQGQGHAQGQGQGQGQGKGAGQAKGSGGQPFRHGKRRKPGGGQGQGAGQGQNPAQGQPHAEGAVPQQGQQAQGAQAPHGPAPAGAGKPGGRHRRNKNRNRNRGAGEARGGEQPPPASNGPGEA